MSTGEARKQRHDASHGHGHALHTLSRFPHMCLCAHVSLCVQTTPPPCPSTAPSRGCVANAWCRSVEASRQQWMRRRDSRGPTRAENCPFRNSVASWMRLASSLQSGRVCPLVDHAEATRSKATECTFQRSSTRTDELRCGRTPVQAACGELASACVDAFTRGVERGKVFVRNGSRATSFSYAN
jgi:hypothetical protein